MDKFSYPFLPYKILNETIIRPMLRVTIKKDNIEFPTILLVDSGADFSMLRTDVIEDIFLTDLSSLEKGIGTAGLGGETRIGWITLKVEFGQGDKTREEKIPFQVPLNPKKNPELCLLGRIPFFYDYRVDFRMGFTDDKTLGKFVIYAQEHKRDANRYIRPLKIKK